MIKPYNIEVKQGTSFHLIIEMKEDNVLLNLANHTAVMKVRQDYQEEILLELTEANNSIIINEEGTIELILTAAKTAALTFKEGIYDLLLTNSYTEVSCVLAGKFSVIKGVSI